MRTILINLLMGLSIFCFTGCETKIGDCKVYTEGNEIFVDGFNYTIGISGVNRTSFNVDFDELDKYVYDFCKKTTYLTVYVTLIAVAGEDKYGNKKYEKITIGAIDTEETKKLLIILNGNINIELQKCFIRINGNMMKNKENERKDRCFLSFQDICLNP